MDHEIGWNFRIFQVFYGFLGSILLDIRQPVMSSFEKPPPPGMTMDWHRPRCFRRAEDVRPLMPLQMATQGAKAIVEGYTPGYREDSEAVWQKPPLFGLERRNCLLSHIW